jgi:hypothetical protein
MKPGDYLELTLNAPSAADYSFSLTVPEFQALSTGDQHRHLRALVERAENGAADYGATPRELREFFLQNSCEGHAMISAAIDLLDRQATPRVNSQNSAM